MSRDTEAEAIGIGKISADILLSIINEINLSLIIHDARQRVVFVNKTAEILFEGAFAETYGMVPHDFGEHENPEVTRILIDALEQGLKSPFIEFPYKTRSGKHRYIKACAIPIRGPRGRVTHAAVVLQDITRSHQLEKEAIMAARLSSIADMAYNLAHEINNPLTGIKLGLNTLHRALEKNENLQVLKSVLNDLNRIQGIVNSFLQARKAPFKPQKARLSLIADIIADVEFHLSGQLAGKDITIQKCTWDDEFYVFIDRNRMHQLFLNSFLNAIHAITITGKIAIRKHIVTRASKANGVELMLCIAISDTGGGFDPYHKKELFERFESMRPGGSGLGLSICRDIITDHNGTMELESVVGKGTTVNLYLPVTYE